MLLKILLVLALLVVIFVVIVLTRPDAFRIERTATIAAPPAVVFKHINDLRKSQAWSPWAKLDPTAKNTFEGPATGPGAALFWSGNAKVGEGRMTITESRANEFVRSRLEFKRPFEATNTTEFLLRPQGEQTVVTWSMSGRNNFMAKAVGLVINCDKMVGDQFEEGLANLNATVSPPPRP